MRFEKIENITVVLVKRGVYRQVQVYSRGGDVYAQYGGGYIRLYRGDRTSLPDVRWEDCDLKDLTYDRFGRAEAIIPATLKAIA